MPVPASKSTEAKVRELCAGITRADTARAQTLLQRMPAAWEPLRAVAARLTAAQRLDQPATKLKGLAVLAADRTPSLEVCGQVEILLNPRSAAHGLARQLDVKIAIVDLGLPDVLADGRFGPQLLRQFRPTIPANSFGRPDVLWDCVNAGIKAAFFMKGKGTDLFGLHVPAAATEASTSTEQLVQQGRWELAAAMGFLLASATLQTPVVISGPQIARVAALARNLAAPLNDYLIPAQADTLIADLDFPPLFDWRLPDELAVILGLGMCDSAAHLAHSQLEPPRS